MNAEQIAALLRAQMPDCEIQVEGDGGKFLVTAIGDCFAGLTPVKKQQLIYGHLNDNISDGSIHAVQMKLFTPEQWAKLNG